MIAEVLDRRFVLSEVARIRDDLTGRLQERRTRGSPPRLNHGEELADAIGDSLQHERAAEAEDVADARDEARRVRAAEDTGPLVEAHFAYLPRDPLVSVMQSLIEEYVSEFRPELVEGGRVPGQRRLRGDSDEELPPVTSLRLVMDAPSGAARVRLLERFSLTDPRWAQSKLSEWFSRWNDKHRFRAADRPEVVRIADDARLILVGDWASGIPRAQRVASCMRRAVEEAMGRGQEVHVIHLGDTYYSGWRREYRNHLLAFWPVRPQEAARAQSWTLNGNHDMYSGGDGYYELLEEPRFAGHRGLSFFQLQSNHWDVLGLDTAYEDHDLAGAQARWVELVVADLQRKTMLFSHHQPFSGYNDDGGALRATLARVLHGERMVDAWFWGHEHRHAHYDRTMGVRNGRLVGHGGVPVWMLRGDRASNPPPENWEYRARLPGRHLQPWAMLGFAILDLSGARVNVCYVNELGSTYCREELI